MMTAWTLVFQPPHVSPVYQVWVFFISYRVSDQLSSPSQQLLGGLKCQFSIFLLLQQHQNSLLFWCCHVSSSSSAPPDLQPRGSTRTSIRLSWQVDVGVRVLHPPCGGLLSSSPPPCTTYPDSPKVCSSTAVSWRFLFAPPLALQSVHCTFVNIFCCIFIFMSGSLRWLILLYAANLLK